MKSHPRRGVVLLVVISLLMLFAIVGIAFVIYAEAQASTARIRKESESLRRPDIDAEELLAYFLGQLIYDTDNPHSALRGHGLARTLYGKPGGTTAFCGLGRRPGDLDINYTAFGAPIDPDQLGSPNPPYTYPDLNNVYLAAVRASDGAVLIPSYHRTSFGGDPANRRQVLRPLPADHNGFPAMEDAGGDVKNLADSPGTLLPGGQFASNDSVWLDLGHPVMTAPDGRKFKPLFAPLIQDLDNRVNVNVHGNMIAPLGPAGGALNGGLDVGNGRHSSHQGWGPWEVNLQKVLPATEVPPNPPAGYENWLNYEARYLFTGSPDFTTPGRFDPAFWGQAGTKNQLLAAYMVKGPSYSKTNSEGDSGDQNSNPFALPTDKCFPNLSGWGWENGDPVAGGRNHEGIWNFFSPLRTACVPNNPPREDRVFGPAHMEALLRYGDNGSPAMDSDLFRLCPRSLADGKARRLVTTHSFDLAVPGVMPGLWGQGMSYRLAAGSRYPTGQAVPFPPAGPTAPPGSEFTPDWKAAAAALARINLNRIVPNYPGPTGANKQITSLDSFGRVQQTRQEMAKDLFDVLRQVTGAADPAAAAGDELEALRWLAQLAVNIVDYTDKDDYLTPFEWRPSEFVFGCELPRLVLNEAYVEIGNSPADAMANTASEPYQVRFWIELHSPIGSVTEGGKVRLKRPSTAPDHACYKIVIVKDPAELDEHNNSKGEPDQANGNIVLDFRDYTADPGFTPKAGVDLSVVRSKEITTGTTEDNNGYYLLGPAGDFPGSDANRPKPTLKVKKNDMLSPPSDLAYDVVNTKDAGQFPTKHTLLLRRLACPYLPHQPNPAGGATPYNPYVTVDYLKDVPVNDAVKVTNTGMRLNPPATVADVAQRFARGRKQPYAAAQQADQKPTTALKDQPQHTFFKRNVPAPTANNNAYNWLTFMDRPLVSPIELLQVSDGKPHELTQRFIADNGTLFAHRAPWFAQDTRIYRLLEFLQAGMFVQGTGPGGRSVGQININTVWDKETFDALTDPRQINRFTQAQSDTIFQNLMQWRTPGGQPGPNDRPFVGAAPPLAGGFPSMGIDRTILAADSADPNPDPAQRRRLFEPANLAANTRNHPYLKFELLNKIANYLTTRSNVFAVWVTVGFFEVTDDSDTSRPPRLGGEIGRAEGRQVRHRLFAIIDRTNLTIDPARPGQPGPRPFFLNTTAAVNAGSNSVTFGGPQGHYEDLAYNIRVGDRLAIDSGSYREVVTVAAISNAAGGLYNLVVQAPFAKRHEVGVPISNAGVSTILGHPGPQPRFDPRNPSYAGIVRYFSIIE